MELSSMDVERKTFRGARRGGFDRDEVSDYLRRVARVLGKLESNLSVSQRHSNELERQLGRAREKAEEGSKSFLHAADMKQRLLAEAEVRVAEILEQAHADSGVSDPVAASKRDLEVIKARFDGDTASTEVDGSVEPALETQESEVEERLELASRRCYPNSPNRRERVPEGHRAGR